MLLRGRKQMVFRRLEIKPNIIKLLFKAKLKVTWAMLRRMLGIRAGRFLVEFILKKICRNLMLKKMLIIRIGLVFWRKFRRNIKRHSCCQKLKKKGIKTPVQNLKKELKNQKCSLWVHSIPALKIFYQRTNKSQSQAKSKMSPMLINRENPSKRQV